MTEATSYEKDIESLVDKYMSKDYWDDNMVVEGKIKQWKSMGEPEPWTEQRIRDEMMINFKNQKIDWLLSVVASIEDKDYNTLVSKIRYDQPVMQEVFSIVTGISLKGKSNKDIKTIIEDYVNS